jgi:integrase
MNCIGNPAGGESGGGSARPGRCQNHPEKWKLASVTGRGLSMSSLHSRVIRSAGVVPVLKAALDAELAARKAAKVSPLKMEDQTICLTSEGEAWQEGRKGYTGFIHMFCEARKAAGIDGVSFGDLRGTAVTRLALAGCTVPEICAITGHSHEDANRILQAHYLHRDPQIAWNAIRKLEAYQVRLATA